MVLVVGGDDPQQREGVYRSSVIVTSYNGVRRGSESSNLSYTDASIEFEACTSRNHDFLAAYFDIQWPAMKIGEFQNMAMGCDMVNWRICFLQALMRFLLVGGADHKRQGTNDNSIFPQTKHLAAASTSVTQYLQDSLDPNHFYGNVEKFHPSVYARTDTSTSVRRGTIRMMKRNKQLGREYLHYRSGHKDASRAEEYDDTEAVDTLPGMKVLNGSLDIYGPCFLPSLRSLCPNARNPIFSNFSVALFGSALPRGPRNDPKLTGLMELLLASMLMDYESWKKHI